MKMLRRLVHRELGCTHEEAWTVSVLPVVIVVSRY
jgi:hypothetical protein